MSVCLNTEGKSYRLPQDCVNYIVGYVGLEGSMKMAPTCKAFQSASNVMALNEAQKLGFTGSNPKDAKAILKSVYAPKPVEPQSQKRKTAEKVISVCKNVITVSLILLIIVGSIAALVSPLGLAAILVSVFLGLLVLAIGLSIFIAGIACTKIENLNRAERPSEGSKQRR